MGAEALRCPSRERTRSATDPVPETPEQREIVTSGPGPDSFRGRTRLERAVLPFLREQTLWPVLGAILAHVIALQAPLLVLAFRDGHGWSFLGVAVFAGITAAVVGLELRERQRPGLIAALFGATWLLCGVGALAVLHFGIV